jgi:type I restriction enzyme S subunit
MSSNRYFLGDLGEFYGGVTSISKKDYGHGTPFLQYKNVYSNARVDVHNLELMNVNARDIERKNCKYGDIFFTASSETPDEVAMSSVLLNDVPKLTFNGFCKRYRLHDFDTLHPRYARYMFRSKRFRDDVTSLATGDTRFNISNQSLTSIAIDVPDVNKQLKTARILEALDDKIELNNRLNGCLAKMRQAVFEKMSNEGETGTLADLCSYSSARTSANELSGGAYISTENMLPDKGGFMKPGSMPTEGQVPAFEPGDTLVSNIRPYFKKIVYAGFSGGCSADVLRFHPSESRTAAYLFCTLHDDKFFEYMVVGAKGTKMPRGDKQQIMNYPVMLLSVYEIDEFNGQTIPLLAQQQSLMNQNARLAALRDTLLPKLMSGEISVDELPPVTQE